MDQFTRALSRGVLSTDEKKPPVVVVELPWSAACYLRDAVQQIKEGVTADDALFLTEGKGQKSQNERNTLFADLVMGFRESGLSLEKAIAKAERYAGLKDGSGKTPYEKGEEGALFIQQLREKLGDDAAEDYVEHLRSQSDLKDPRNKQKCQG